MRYRLLPGVLFLASGLAAAGAPEFPDPHSLATELHRLEAALDAGEQQRVLRELPSAWLVDTPRHQYSIPAKDFRELLEPGNIADAKTWLGQTASELEGFTQAAADVDTRARLDRILARREFAGVQPPGFWETLIQRILSWIGRLIAGLIKMMGPTGGRVFFQVAATGAVLLLAFWLYRYLGRKGRIAPPAQPDRPVSTRSWEDWVRSAREAIEQGDLRSAVRFAYWAGVARLQHDHVLPRDVTRTPREYLSLMPAHFQSYGSFAALTSGLERYWYAGRRAAPEDLQKLMSNMEELGCPPGLSRADRRLLLGGGAVLLALLIGTVTLGPVAAPESPVPTIYSSSSGGARAAWLLLGELHYDVREWTEPPASLATAPQGALLILAEPTELPTARERAALLDFVNRGGHILFCGATIPGFFPKARTTQATPNLEWRQYSASMPGFLSHDANTITMNPTAFWKLRDVSQLRLYGQEDSATVVDWRLGAGDILWWASATPLTNAGLKQTDNLNFFLNSVSGSNPGTPVTILWDEYFHGQRSSLASFVAKTPLLWAGLQILGLGFAALFTFSRRSGPIMSPAPISRLSPLEFVETMGGLYQRAGAASIPVGVCYRHLRLVLLRRLGQPLNLPDAELARLAAERLALPGRELGEDLSTACSYTFDARVSVRDALALVKRLEGYVAQVETPKALHKENH